MIKKLFRQMLLTQILSSMTVMLCMLIDSIMIGRFLGVDSMTAYGLATPVLLVFAALGSMLSAGVQVMCGKTMGAGDKKGTDACFTMSSTFCKVASRTSFSSALEASALASSVSVGTVFSAGAGFSAGNFSMLSSMVLSSLLLIYLD
jgi:hypothetical protein